MKRAEPRHAPAHRRQGQRPDRAGWAWFLALGLAALGTAARANPELAREKGCLGCHALEQRVVGPAFAEVAKRYVGKPAALGSVSKHIREGLKGAWGEFPMPAQPHVQAAEAETLARWILQRGS
jgi:cytochrome c